MTQTLQDALLKAGLVTQDKLKKAEAEKRAAKFAHKSPAAPPPPPRNTHSVNIAKSSPKPVPARPVRPQIKRVAPETKGPGFLEHKHIHHLRTECESCQKTSPDVEYYEHPNRSFQYYWLCVKCADDHSILDQYRQTKQSQHAMSGFFRRNYGPTKIFK